MSEAPIPVLLLVRELHLGGCERDLTKIATHIDRSRFTPHVGCFIPDGVCRPALDAAGVPVIHFPVTSFKSWSAISSAKMLRRYAGEHGIRLVHAFDVPMCGWGVPAARAAGVPVVLSSQLSFRTTELAVADHLRMMRWGDRLATHFFVNSQAVFDHMVNDERIPASKITLAHNGVDTELFYPAISRPEDEVVIGALCGLRPEKRLDLLVQAFARLKDSNLRLLITGSGSEEGMLREMAARLGVAAATHFEPATRDAPCWLRKMHIFALTSSTESFPNALLEAMACGCAVVGSNMGGVAELIDAGRTGLLFPPGDVPALTAALQRLVDDPDLRANLGAAAAVEAREKFSVERYVSGMESLYSRLLNGR